VDAIEAVSSGTKVVSALKFEFHRKEPGLFELAAWNMRVTRRCRND